MATRIERRLRDEREALERERGRSSPPLKAVAEAQPVAEPPDEDATVKLARRIYDLRRRRDERFGAELFSEPAWDILLHLFVAGGRQEVVSVSSACDGAAAPPTTALRKLRQLEEEGWIVREGDPGDARRSYVRLSYRATRKMRSLLKGACSGVGQGP